MTNHNEIPAEFLSTKDALVDAARAALLLSDTPPPSTLYHFTDATGVIGIVGKRSIWLSSANSLNDASEIAYGVELAHSVLADESLATSEFRARVAHFLNPHHQISESDPIPPFHPFVTSFCAGADSSVHWLHYGRSGTGFALGFDAKQLSCGGVTELVRVEYDLSAQRSILRRIVDTVWHVLSTTREDVIRVLFDVAAHATAVHLRFASIRFKSESFSNENEWRLVTLDTTAGFNNTEGKQETEMNFRAAGSRIVPYQVFTFETLPLREIVLGYSVAMSDRDLALDMLLQRSCVANVITRRSTVPVRA